MLSCCYAKFQLDICSESWVRWGLKLHYVIQCPLLDHIKLPSWSVARTNGSLSLSLPMYVCAGRKNVNFFRTQSLSRNLEARILTAICHPFRFLMGASESSVSRCCCCCPVGHQQRKTARHKQKQQKTVRLGQSGREREREGAERECLVGGWGFRLALTVLVVVVSCLRGGYSFAMLLLLLGGSWRCIFVTWQKKEASRREEEWERKNCIAAAVWEVYVCVYVYVFARQLHRVCHCIALTHTHTDTHKQRLISVILPGKTHTLTQLHMHISNQRLISAFALPLPQPLFPASRHCQQHWDIRPESAAVWVHLIGCGCQSTRIVKRVFASFDSVVCTRVHLESSTWVRHTHTQAHTNSAEL